MRVTYCWCIQDCVAKTKVLSRAAILLGGLNKSALQFKKYKKITLFKKKKEKIRHRLVTF